MTQTDPAPSTSATPTDRSLVTVITGGGSGIGRAVAHAFLSRGHRVAVCGRRPDALTETLDSHPDGLAVVMDVTDPESVDAGFAAVRQHWGRVDVLFNNAGTSGSGGSVDEIDVDDWNAVVATNLTGSLLCAAAAVRIMKTQQPRGGRVINNGSISAHAPRPRSVAYTATKHAITGLTKSIELDGRDSDVRCGQIDIGNAATGMMSDIGVSAGAPQPNGTRLVEPTFDVAEVGSAVLWMAELPLGVSVNTMTITAAGMPFVGRG